MPRTTWRIGSHTVPPALALALALHGIAPAALAADDDRGRAEPASRTLSGTATEVFGKHFILTLEDGRRVLVDLSVRGVVVTAGERVEVTGSDEAGEFEATRLVRSDGTVVAVPDQAEPGRERPSAVAAHVGAAGAIAAVERAGYTTVTELEWEDGAWEIEALDAQGRATKLRVDPSTGEVAPQTE